VVGHGGIGQGAGEGVVGRHCARRLRACRGVVVKNIGRGCRGCPPEGALIGCEGGGRRSGWAGALERKTQQRAAVCVGDSSSSAQLSSAQLQVQRHGSITGESMAVGGVDSAERMERRDRGAAADRAEAEAAAGTGQVERDTKQRGTATKPQSLPATRAGPPIPTRHGNKSLSGLRDQWRTRPLSVWSGLRVRCHEQAEAPSCCRDAVTVNRPSGPTGAALRCDAC
jgi:hypothetical protein